MIDINELRENKVHELARKLEPRKFFVNNKDVTFIGIDWSVNHPAMIIYTKGRFDVYYVNLLNGVENPVPFPTNFDNAKLYFHPFPYESKETFEAYDKKRLEFYDTLSNKFISAIKEKVDENKPVFIAIEGHSQQSTVKGMILKSYPWLIESQVIFRLKLKKLNLGPLFIFAPTAIKKFFSGNGRSGKMDMAKAWRTFLPEIGPCLGKKPMLEYKANTKPMEDIVDAMAVTLLVTSFIFTFN